MNKKAYLIVLHVFAGVGLLFLLVYVAILLGFTKTSGIKDPLNRLLDDGTGQQAPQSTDWANTEEYQSFKKSVVKDESKIKAAAEASGVSPRLIVSALLSEQIRLYTDSSRESFKQFFQPLSILGIQSQYSWGVMGIKQETAIQIENNLKDPSSEFYIGQRYESLLDFKTEDADTERFDRLVDEDNQYYSYLYAGIYMQQIMTQWSNAGFSLAGRPDVVATLYNIGFIHSKPNSNPSAGGAEIRVGGKTYSFGGLASSFYNSNELAERFPR